MKKNNWIRGRGALPPDKAFGNHIFNLYSLQGFFTYYCKFAIVCAFGILCTGGVAYTLFISLLISNLCTKGCKGTLIVNSVQQSTVFSLILYFKILLVLFDILPLFFCVA